MSSAIEAKSSYLRFESQRPVKIDTQRTEELIREITADPMGGWLKLPESYDRVELERIKAVAKKIQSDSQFLVCIGIGGSYLGHRALIEALQPQSPTKILYAGNSLSERELVKVFNDLGDADFSINVISKSGTTTEPAVAFRFLKEKLAQKYGSAASSRIYATTDAHVGALHDEAVECGYERFTVPDNIGGRYSVLTAVGLLPLTVAGVDIDHLLSGARDELLHLKSDFSCPLVQYAYSRYQLLQEQYDTEILATFEPCLHEFSEWWKQLFGESEGKHHQGIFPAAVTYTTDLHSLGQYMQDGRRNIFETVLDFQNPSNLKLVVPSLPADADGLAYLAGKQLSEINQKALEATIDAHRQGGIPVFRIIAPELNATALGHLIFFFEASCALSAKLANINPFDQPGVEAYKNRMFSLLGKPGY